MKRVDEQFKDRVYALVARIPKGKVMTYGQIAGLCGNAAAAWEVGQIARFGPSDLPWQRVVNKQGGLARGFAWGGVESHKHMLEADGVSVREDYTVDLSEVLWHPQPNPAP